MTTQWCQSLESWHNQHKENSDSEEIMKKYREHPRYKAHDQYDDAIRTRYGKIWQIWQDMAGLCEDLADSHIKHMHMKSKLLGCVEIHGEDLTKVCIV